MKHMVRTWIIAVGLACAWPLGLELAVGPAEAGHYNRAHTGPHGIAARFVAHAQQEEPTSPRRQAPITILQINDVYWDDRGLVFIGDRFTGGLYILELNI